MKYNNKWASWGILVFGFVIVFFHRLSIGSVADQLTLDLNLSSIQIANLASMTFYGYALMQLPVGLMVDSIGVRKICTVGMFVTAIASILFATAGNIYVAYFARFLVGIGTSVIIVSIMKIQSTLFEPNVYSTLSGLTSFFGNFGAFFATIPLSIIALNLGWRHTFWVLGLVTVFLALAIHFIVKDQSIQDISLNNLRGAKAVKSEKIEIKEAIIYVISNKKVYPDFFVMVFFVGSLTAVLGLWGNEYMKTVYHISTEKAAFYLSFITYGFIIGAPIVGKISDLLGGEVKKILLFATAINTILWTYILVIQKGQPPLKLWTFIYFVMGLMTICHILIFSNVKDINPLKYTGTAIALINIGEFVGSGLISYLIGVTISKLKLNTSSIEDVYISAMMIVLISAVLSFIGVLFMKSDTRESH